MGSFMLVRQDFADVVKQRATAREVDVECELGGHNPGEPGYFLRVIEDVLSVTRSPTHAADQLDQFRVESVNAAFVRRLLTGFDNRGVDFLARFVDDFLDTTGMNAAVRDKLFQRQARDLAPNGIEAGDNDGVRRVIDDDVDAGGELERANVPPFAADDSAFHFIVRQRNRRHRRFDALFGGNALDRQGDDLFRLTIGVALGSLANLPDLVGGIGLRLFAPPMHALVYCNSRAKAPNNVPQNAFL